MRHEVGPKCQKSIESARRYTQCLPKVYNQNIVKLIPRYDAPQMRLDVPKCPETNSEEWSPLNASKSKANGMSLSHAVQIRRPAILHQTINWSVINLSTRDDRSFDIWPKRQWTTSKIMMCNYTSCTMTFMTETSTTYGWRVCSDKELAIFEVLNNNACKHLRRG